jgi:hypothetical protein
VNLPEDTSRVCAGFAPRARAFRGVARFLGATLLLLVGGCRRTRPAPASIAGATSVPARAAGRPAPQRVTPTPGPCPAVFALSGLHATISDIASDNQVVVRVAGSVRNLGPKAWTNTYVRVRVGMSVPDNPRYRVREDAVGHLEVGQERSYEAFCPVSRQVPVGAKFFISLDRSYSPPDTEKNCSMDGLRAEIGESEIRALVARARGYAGPREGTLEVPQWRATRRGDGLAIVEITALYTMNASSGHLDVEGRSALTRPSVPVDTWHSKADISVMVSCREDLGPVGTFDLRLVLRDNDDLRHAEKPLGMSFRDVCGPGPALPYPTASESRAR